RRRDGGVDGGEHRRARGLRHGEGRREGRDDRARRPAREIGREVGTLEAHAAISTENRPPTAQAGLADPVTVKTALIHSDAWTRFDYGPEHPLRMERLGLTWRLMQAYGLTTLPNAVVRAPEPAAEPELAIYHDAEYLEMLKACNSGRAPQLAARFGLGPGDNPVFPGLWDAARLCAGGSLLAADLVAYGRADRAFHFAGGLHHAMPARASGFCYVNDAVLAILRLRSRGMRVLYIDIDAHHGVGVQHAFYGDPNVLTISTH